MNSTKKVKLTTPKNALQMVMESSKIQVELEAAKKNKQKETKKLELSQESQPAESTLKRSRHFFFNIASKHR